VLAVGDAAFQKKCLGKMGEVAKEGRTVLFVSHNMGAVSQLTQRSVLLDSGRITLDGETEKVIDRYLKNPDDLDSNLYDVSNLKNRYPDILNRAVEFVTAELLTQDNSNFLLPREPISIRLTVKGNRSVKNFRFSLTIFQANGNPVGSTFAPELCSINKGEKASFDLILNNLPLSQGQYYLAIATGEGTNLTGQKEFDIITNVLYFNILPKINEFGTQAYWTTGWGSIEFDKPLVRKVTAESG
jgi:lipopolysaccharide transport system ATP-binding protein